MAAARIIRPRSGSRKSATCIVFEFKSDGPGLAKGGTGVLYMDGK